MASLDILTGIIYLFLKSIIQFMNFTFPSVRLLRFFAWFAVGLTTLQPTFAAERDDLSALANDATSATDLHDAMVADLKFLTSEELQGRSSVDSTILEAADYIAERFRGLGLQTDLFDGTPLQFIDISVGPQIASGDSNFLVIESSTEPAGDNSIDLQNLRVGRDFTPLAIGASNQSVTGDVVWVGYGVRAPEYDYDDYAALDVQGKVVMMLRKEPGANNADSPFDGVGNTRHAFFETKIATAIEQGASAVLIVNDPASVENMVAAVNDRRQGELDRLTKIREQLLALPPDAVNAREKLNSQITRIEEMLNESDDTATAKRGLLDIVEAGMQSQVGIEHVESPDGSTPTTRPAIPVLSISRGLANRLLSNRLPEIEAEIDADWKPRSLELPGTQVRLGVELTPSTVRSPNVIGVLPGHGALADETIVIGAHYDHVGMGEFGSLAPGTVAVHNGADDNASGTATMLRVAGNLVRRLAGENQPTSHRRIVFIAFTGEERGLLGSKHYVEQPRFPISSTVAMINMDMVGRLNDNELTIYGTGTADGFEDLIAEINDSAKFRIIQVKSGYGPSDHASFYEAGIPVLFFFTGLHSDYHRPSDDFNKLNLTGMDRITDTISQAAERLATMPERPIYAETDKEVQIRHQLTVSMGVKLSQEADEVIIAEIREAGPADIAGVQAGDRLRMVGEASITRIADVLDQLRLRSPDDVLSIVVQRDTEELPFEITLLPR